MFDSYAYSFTKILIRLINDSNHSSKFTALVVVAFTKEEKLKKIKTASKAYTQPSSEYCSVCTRIIFIL